MEKKSTMGSNPLQEYLGGAAQKDTTDTLGQKTSEGVCSVKKERITIHLPVDLIDRVKNAVFWEPGMTLTAFAEVALEAELKIQIKKRGAPYPERKERTLKSGRPVV